MSNLPAYATFTVAGIAMTGTLMTVANARIQWRREWRARALDNYIEMMILANLLRVGYMDLSRLLSLQTSGGEVDRTKLAQVKATLEGKLAKSDELLTHVTKVEVLSSRELYEAGGALMRFFTEYKELPIQDLDQFSADYAARYANFSRAGRKHFGLPRR